ncbi:MAG: YfcE family phosphodiesterase [Olsenella sp.]|jgi:putative phosphoesterase|nr:YfcE family phosphodiesterase [Olsenella sp.]MCI1288261.1 YfcE family phosphodiesterase [Olsenella sp.]
MVRLMVCSDIHARIGHFQDAVVAARAEGPIDAIVIAGDLQMPAAAIEELNLPEPIYLVHGNNDAALAPSHPADELAIDVAPDGVAAVHELAYHEAAPARGAGVSHRIMVTHGHTYRAPRLVRLRQRAATLDADIVIYGHSHRWQEDAGGPSDALVLNSGTLMPKPGSGRCTFMTLRLDGEDVYVDRYEL